VVNLHVAPVRLQIFGHQAAMALVGCFFAAEEAAAVQEWFFSGLFNLADAHKGQEFFFVGGPGAFFSFVSVEHFFAGSEVGQVLVVDVADRFGEIAQVFFFGEAGELGDVVETDVEEALDAGVREAGEKLLGGLFGEADGENLHVLIANFSRERRHFASHALHIRCWLWKTVAGKLLEFSGSVGRLARYLR
jgi:hypothetical protein